VGLLRAAFHRGAVAGLLARGLRGRAGRVRGAPAPVRRAMSGPRRSVAADLTARVLVAIPAAAYAIFIIAAGGWVFAIGILVLGFVCLHELFCTWCAGLYQDWLSGVDALILGAAVGIAAPIGDLFESAVKRDAGTKDAGTLFGTHGGALDRLDAAFFTLVTGYYVWLALLQ